MFLLTHWKAEKWYFKDLWFPEKNMWTEKLIRFIWTEKLIIFVQAVEMLENKHRPRKDSWRKAFIAIIITDTVNVNAAGAYLQNLGQCFAQKQTSDLSQYVYFLFFHVNLKGIDSRNWEIKSSKSRRSFLPLWKYFIRASHLWFCSILKGIFKQGGIHDHCDCFIFYFLEITMCTFSDHVTVLVDFFNFCTCAP